MISAIALRDGCLDFGNLSHTGSNKYRNKDMKFSFFIKLILFIGTSVLNIRVSMASEIYQSYTGARELAMGGAYVNTVNDETSLELNPAGLGRLRSKIITLADPELEVGSNDQQIFSTNGNYLGMVDPTIVFNNCVVAPSTHYHLKLQFLPSIVLPDFGFGIHAMRRIDGEADSTAANFHLDYTQDIDAVLGINFKFFGGIVKIGVATRYIDHSTISKDFVVASTTSISVPNSGTEGTGLGVNVGGVISIPVEYLPSIGFTVHDLGNTSYNLTAGSVYQGVAGRPPDSIQTVDAGLAIFPIMGARTRSTFTAEVHDIATLSTETSLMRRVHVGGEINIGDLLFIRAGLNQSYYTAGLEFASERMQFQVTSYGEEIGTATQPKEDRRYLGKFSFRF